MTVFKYNNMYITTIADSYVQINYSLSLSLSLYRHSVCTAKYDQYILECAIQLRGMHS